MKPHLLVLSVALAVCALPAAWAEDEAVTKVHDVGAFLAPEEEPRTEVLGLPPGIAPPGWPDEPDEEDDPVTFLDVDTLEEIVEAAVARTELEAQVRIEGRHLVVRGPASVHALVEQRLSALWREATQRIDIEGHCVRLGARGLDALRAVGVLEALERGRLDDDARDILIQVARDAGAKISAASSVVRPGGRATLGRVEARSYVQDYEVEIAQDSVVGDPVVRPLATGWFADVRPFLMQDGSVYVELVGQVARVEGEIRVLPLEVKPFGSVELPVCSVLRFAGTARARAGQTLVWLSAPDGAAGGVDLLLLRLDARRAARATGPVRRYDIGALTAEPLGWRLVRAPGHQHDQGALTPPRLVPAAAIEPLMEQDALIDALILEFDEEIWERGGTSMTQVQRGLLIEGDETIHAGVAALMKTQERACDTGRVGIRLHAADDAGATTLLAAAWLELPYGRAMGWQAGVERAYVADWGVEVAQEARTGDPIVAKVFGGLAMDLTLGRGPGAGHAMLRLDASLSRVHEKIEVRHLENDCTGVVEVPRLDRALLRQDLALEVGVAQRIAAGSLPDGRRLTLEVVLVR